MTRPATILLPNAFLDPKVYPHHPASVELKETHISWVFLAGDTVYKCKKPVKTDFLDFSSLERRRHACDEEVRLNRRLAPDTYLGVVPATRTNGHVSIDGKGTPIEWLVQMRRLPEQEALDQRFRQGRLHHYDIERLAAVLAAFYQNLCPAEMTSAEYRERFLGHVKHNRDELLAVSHHLPVDLVKRIHASQLQLLHLQRELFDDRVAKGYVIEGHGDLRPEHICLTEPLVIFDCIEFSREFRTLDIADELAFFISECDHLGASWVGATLLEEMTRLLGEECPKRLFNFYKSYRSCVRAKVAALRADQLTGSEQQAAICQARNYLQQAERYLQPVERPLLLVVGGLSGTGKSTLALQVAAELGADLLRTDVIRQELFAQHSPQAVNSGVYQLQSRKQVYEEILLRAKQSLQSQCSVVLDGTFGDPAVLDVVRHLAITSGARLLAIECTCPTRIAKERIASRLDAGQDASRATMAVYDQQHQSWVPWSSEIPQCQVDTTQPLETQLQIAFSALSMAS